MGVHHCKVKCIEKKDIRYQPIVRHIHQNSNLSRHADISTRTFEPEEVVIPHCTVKSNSPECTNSKYRRGDYSTKDHEILDKHVHG